MFDQDKGYSLSSIRDNVQLLTPEIMDRINQEVVRAGRNIIGQNKSEELSERCDSFVTKTWSGNTETESKKEREFTEIKKAS